MCRIQFRVGVAVLASCCFHIDQTQAEPLPIARVTFYSRSVAREMRFNIILPAGYEKSGKRYPVLYLLHGRNGNLDRDGRPRRLGRLRPHCGDAGRRQFMVRELGPFNSRGF